MRRLSPFVLLQGLLPLTLAGCHEGYSPNTYASDAAQEEATVQRGVIIGVRQVMISANGSIGAATGGAAGGVAGAQVSGGPLATALGAIGGTLLGGIGGTAAAQAVADTKGWEYIVQESGDKLVSITQTSKTALPVGQHVLVIAAAQQARIVSDYTLPVVTASTAKLALPPGAKAVTHSTETAAAPNDLTSPEIHATPLSPEAGTAGPSRAAPVMVASDATIQPPPKVSAGPVPTPPAPSSTSGQAGTTAVNNRSSTIGTPAAISRVTSVQIAPGETITIPQEGSVTAATP